MVQRDRTLLFSVLHRHFVAPARTPATNKRQTRQPGSEQDHRDRLRCRRYVRTRQHVLTVLAARHVHTALERVVLNSAPNSRRAGSELDRTRDRADEAPSATRVRAYLDAGIIAKHIEAGHVVEFRRNASDPTDQRAARVVRRAGPTLLILDLDDGGRTPVAVGTVSTTAPKHATSAPVVHQVPKETLGTSGVFLSTTLEATGYVAKTALSGEAPG